MNVFVAQYYGAGVPGRIGPALWQGVYIAVIGGVLLGMGTPVDRQVRHTLIATTNDLLVTRSAS